jgi:hypothetical protein
LQPQDCPREPRASQLAASDAFGKREDRANQERGVLFAVLAVVSPEWKEIGNWSSEIEIRCLAGKVEDNKAFVVRLSLNAASPIVTPSNIIWRGMSAFSGRSGGAGILFSY